MSVPSSQEFTTRNPFATFGRPTSRAFEPQSAFAQANNANNSGFAPQSAFDSPAVGIVSGGASTGVFGCGSTRTPSPFSSEAAFGASSSSAFGGSREATPTVGRTEFGNSSFEGQPRGSRVAPFTPTSIWIDEVTEEMLPFKLQSICGMTVPVYQYKSHEELRWEDYRWGDKGGSYHAGQSGVSVGRPGASPAIPRPTFSRSSPFPSTAASNAVSPAPASATTSNPVAPTPSSNAVLRTASHPSPCAVGSSIFCSSMPWGAQSQSVFRASSNPDSGSTTPASGSTPMVAFGATSYPLFGSGRAFGVSSNAAFGSYSPFGQSETAFRSSQFGSGSYGARTGSQVGTPTVGRTEFGNSSFGGQPMGSRVAPFTPIPIDDGLSPKLQSICGMPLYECESHEELRWEDYQRGDKGGPNHAGQSGVSVGRPGASSAIPQPTFSQPSPFSSTTASNASSSAPVHLPPSPVLSTNADAISRRDDCPVCLTKPKNMAFGCGHMTCGECALKLSSCPICRQAINIRLRVYM